MGDQALADQHLRLFRVGAHAGWTQRAGEAWLTWSIVAAAYVLAFLQRVAPQAVLDQLMVGFDVGASGVGHLTSAYFYGYMAMQLAAGVLVDRYGVRKVLTVSTAVSALGVLWFSSASTLMAAAAARAIVAVADAVVFTALLKVSAQSFPPGRFGFMVGLSQLSGYLGGLLATTPLALLAGVLGWRSTFMLLAGLGLANSVLLLLALREATEMSRTPPSLQTIIVHGFTSLRRPAVWGPIITFLGTYVPSLSLSGVWGLTMLVQAYGFPRTGATASMFVFMLSYALGALAFGYVADTPLGRSRDLLVVIGMARVGLLVLIAPAVGSHVPVVLVVSALAALGFAAGGINPLTIASLHRLFSTARLGVAIGLSSTLANLGTALAQPILGRVLDASWTGATVAHLRIYPPEGYSVMLMLLALISVCSVVGPLIGRAPR